MMSLFVECTTCNSYYARVLLPEDAPRCRCGDYLDVEAFEDESPEAVDPQLLAEEVSLGELSRMVDYISFLIISTDTLKVDIEIKSADLKRRCVELFPEKGYLFDLLYKSRFCRLWEQFRDADGRCLDRQRNNSF
jgi:hypothetical protein